MLDSVRRARPLPAGRTLFEAGDEPDAVYCVNTGLVKLLLGVGDEEHILRLAGPGAFLGLRELLQGGPHRRTAVVLEAGEICRFPAAQALSLLAETPPFVRDVMLRMTGEIDDLERRLAERACLKGVVRLASLLAGLIASGRKTGSLLLKRRDLAQMLGVAPESAVRLLAELRRRKLIRIAGSRIDVPDRGALETFAREQSAGGRIRPSR